MIVAPARTAAAASAASSGQDTNGFLTLITYLRETNAEALRIHDRLAEAIGFTTAVPPQTSVDPFVKARDVINDEVRAAAARAAALQPLRQSDADDFARYARELVQVDNAWADLDQIWSPLTSPIPPLADFVASAHQSLAILDRLAFLCALQTIPNELDNYLSNYRIGQKLDFVTTFKDQLPTEQATRDVLAALAPQSAVISGLVDVVNGMIVKASSSIRRQVLSVVFILLTVALGFGLIAFAVAGPWRGWLTPSASWSALNGAYLLVLLGVLAHWILDRLKLSRAGADLLPLSEWLLWLHVNEVQIIVRIVTIWFVVGLGIAFKVFNLANGVPPVTYFTAGYFLDSTFDALVGRLNTFLAPLDPAAKIRES